MSPSYQNPQSFGTTPNSWLNPFITMSFCMLFHCLENSPPNFSPLYKSPPFIWRTFLIQYLCWRDRQVDPRSSLVSQSSLLDKLQTSEKPCLWQQGEWLLKNNNHGCLLASTCMHTSMHGHADTFGRLLHTHHYYNATQKELIKKICDERAIVHKCIFI